MDNSKYQGMTVNERLYISGRIDEYDDAVKKKDTIRVINILKEVGLSEIDINPIVKHEGLSK